MRLVFLERKEIHEKIKALVAKQLKGFPDYSSEEATLMENQLIHYSRLRDTLDMRLKLYDRFVG